MLGGGGHRYAAAASVKDKTLPEVRHFLLMKASMIMNADVNAGVLMSAPVVGAYDHMNMSEALSLMNRYGLKAVPVFKQGSHICLGLLTQEIAARAVGHGLGRIDVSVYMQRSYYAVPARASLQELVDIMVGNQQRLIPVVEGDDIDAPEVERKHALRERNVVGVVLCSQYIIFVLQESRFRSNSSRPVFPWGTW